ncbi:hypothetical protein [Mucilaginibacter lacusdianchii]|uniref:hypothetical protein n=1 Tax=Mucilaginibacter lacusdianchii TaxID=2684211 RepID=UPI00131D03CF|nr:hypothetical protein [Mucilaginibacter sp. JXJ CY 39]
MKKQSIKAWAAFLAFTILLFTGKTYSQTSGHDSRNVWRLGIGAEAAIPTGNMRDLSHIAVGGTARLQYDIKGTTSLTLTSGYYNFFAREYVVRPDYAIIPVKVGAKVFFVPHAYIIGEIGAGLETKEYYGKNTKLILAPGVGYATNSGVDIGLRYENISGGSTPDFGMVALRIAYGFRL